MLGQKKYRHLFFSFFCLLTGFIAAQEKQAPKPVWKQDTIIKDNVFKKYSNWLSGGAGIANNNHFVNSQFTGGVDYNFHIEKKYFQLGLFLSGDQYGSYNNYQFHLCYGKRVESGSINFSYFGGLSYSIFFKRQGSIYESLYLSDIGLYVNAEYILKIVYDVGIGVGAFADLNGYQSIIGTKIDLFFCGSYKGKKDFFY